MSGVVVISKDNCVKCMMTKKFLSNNNIDFEEQIIDPLAEESKELVQKFRDLGFSAFPVVFPNGLNVWEEAWCDYQLDNLRSLV